MYESVISVRYLGYDNAHNLFADGNYNVEVPEFAELPNGASDFTQLSVPRTLGIAGQIQWDGQYMTWESETPKKPAICELSVTGSQASIVHTTVLKGLRHRVLPGMS